MSERWREREIAKMRDKEWQRERDGKIEEEERQRGKVSNATKSEKQTEKDITNMRNMRKRTERGQKEW